MRDAAAGAVDADAAARLAAELMALFEQAARAPDKLQWVVRHVSGESGEPGGQIDPVLARASAAVAAAIDARPAHFDRHSYHNRQHYCEVALTAHGLCSVNGVGVAATQFVVLAALIHDAVHEGRPQPAFVQERASLDSTRPLLEATGLDAAQIDRLLVLMLATDPASGIAFMAATWRAHAGISPMPLAALMTDPALAQLARLLCEADVLPSIGLDAEHATRVQERLAQEWRRPLGAQDKLAFVDFVLEQGYIGGFFLPRVQAMRAAVAASLHDVAQG